MSQRNYLVAGTNPIPPHSIVQYPDLGAPGVVLANMPAKRYAGVSGNYKGDAEVGSRLDIIKHGLCQVRLGDVVEAGQPLCSSGDGTGNAVYINRTAANCIGYAEESGVAGDIIWMYVNINNALLV